MGKSLDRLSYTLGTLLNARGLKARLSEYRILGKWEQTVGGVIARHTRPVSVRGSRLYLAVDSPAWMQQLSLLKPEIIEKVNRNLGKNAIREIVLNLGEIEHQETPSEKASAPAALSREEYEKIEDFVAEVRDPDVRHALRRVIEKDFLNKKTKQKR